MYAKTLQKSFLDEPSKDFELTTTDGRKIKLSDLKGKVVLLDFWATWCSPCVESIPILKNLYDKYEDQGFEILYISADSPAEIYKVRPFSQKYEIDFPVLLAEGVQHLYQAKSFPTTIIIDKKGKIKLREVGFNRYESPRKFETAIKLLLEDI